MENSGRKMLFCDSSLCGELLQEGIIFLYDSSVENCCREVLFCDTEPVWRPVAGMYCFVMRSQCGELFQEGVVL